MWHFSTSLWLTTLAGGSLSLFAISEAFCFSQACLPGSAGTQLGEGAFLAVLSRWLSDDPLLSKIHLQESCFWGLQRGQMEWGGVSCSHPQVYFCLSKREGWRESSVCHANLNLTSQNSPPNPETKYNAYNPSAGEVGTTGSLGISGHSHKCQASVVGCLSSRHSEGRGKRSLERDIQLD